MKIKFIPLLLYTLTLLLIAASCRQEDGSPVRNVRFDPKLLNPVKGGACASYSYFYENGRADLGSVYTKQMIISFAEGSSYEEQKSIAAKYVFIKNMGNQTSTNSAMLYTVELVSGLNCKQTEQAINILANDPMVAYAAPYFIQGKNLLGLSNEAMVTVRAGGEATLQRMLQDYKANLVASLGNEVYVVRVDKNSNGNALELANHLKEQDGIAHAEPDFVVSVAPAHPGLNRGLNGANRAAFVR
ncbi:hypothetical protein [Pontibacter sp. H249]|uniref:hypothetical protein n=1 Tax=Pontibacter sp. H249 TaxID=3133420 RepID=UPI0030C25262